MSSAIEDAVIQHYFIPTLNLPDPDNRHVLAAAIVGHADAIVTFNRKDFPDDSVARHEIDILLKKPPKSAAEYILTLEQQGLPQMCQLLRHAITLI